MKTAFSGFSGENLTWGSVRPQNCRFLLLTNFFMPEKADFYPLCQPTIGAHGGRLVEHGAAV